MFFVPVDPFNNTLIISKTSNILENNFLYNYKLLKQHFEKNIYFYYFEFL